VKGVICSRKYNGIVARLDTISELTAFQAFSSDLYLYMLRSLLNAYDRSHAACSCDPYCFRRQSSDKNETTDVGYVIVHFLFDFCDGNPRAASGEYQRQYPNPRQPTDVFATVQHSQGETGAFVPPA
jgi:hypothetical protein